MTKRSKKKHLPKKKAVTQPVSDMPSWWTAKRLHLMGIFLLAVLLYANTLTHDYTQDDAIVIYENEFTTQGLAGIPDILKYDTFRGFFKEEGKDQLVAGGRYRPLTLVMFAAEVELFGQSPLVGHLINILLYGLVGVLLYLVLLQFG
ncbi:MAG: tetratricopeptide repeat protein, partial [Bacteroidota bacterium]